jgi:hypothetical protein
MQSLITYSHRHGLYEFEFLFLFCWIKGVINFLVERGIGEVEVEDEDEDQGIFQFFGWTLEFFRI